MENIALKKSNNNIWCLALILNEAAYLLFVFVCLFSYLVYNHVILIHKLGEVISLTLCCQPHWCSLLLAYNDNIKGYNWAGGFYGKIILKYVIKLHMFFFFSCFCVCINTWRWLIKQSINDEWMNWLFFHTCLVLLYFS